MHSELIEYQHGDQQLEGYFVSHDDSPQGTPRPGVLISHAWGGLGEFERDKAHAIAELGYNAFALDMYGKGIRGQSMEENRQLMGAFLADRALLRDRIRAGLTTLSQQPNTDSQQLAALGFCFGGLCVLDLARSGAPVRGVASFHGLFDPPDLPAQPITAKVLALHGYDDPMVPPGKVTALANELTAAKVDWQIHAYGLTGHAFTNPKADNKAAGMFYHPDADRRSWQTLQDFLKEIFFSR